VVRSLLRSLLLSSLVASFAACSDSPAATTGSGGATSSSVSTATTSGSGGGTGGAEPAVAWCNRGPKIKICKPYSLRLGGADPSDAAYWDLVTNVLGLKFHRPESLFLDRFDADPASCAECDAAAAHGLYLGLVVRNDGGPTQPTSVPKDLSAYKTSLSAALDRYRDALAYVVIEDEATSASRYAGSVSEYLAELKAGCAAAHEKHLKCADSGIGSTTLLFVLAQYYATSGFAGEAMRILRTAKSNPDVPQAFKDGTATAADLDAFLAAQKDEIDQAKALFSGLRDADVDYANFHFYEEDQDTLDEAIAFMRMVTGCNAVITNELGLRVQDGMAALHQLGDAKEYGLTFVTWSAPGTPGFAGLLDDQGNLLPNGVSLESQSMIASCDD
jgi:hypothetical protein